MASPRRKARASASARCWSATTRATTFATRAKSGPASTTTRWRTSATRWRRSPVRRRPSPPAPACPRDATWIRPELVGEFGFSEWTRDGKLRHPRYLGLRDDKSPARSSASSRPRRRRAERAALLETPSGRRVSNSAVCHCLGFVAGAARTGRSGVRPSPRRRRRGSCGPRGPCARGGGRGGRCGRSRGACPARLGRGSGSPPRGGGRSRRRRSPRSRAGSPRRMGSPP